MIQSAAMRKTLCAAVTLWFCTTSAALYGAKPEAWVPARWSGGPLELLRRAQSKPLPADSPLRAAIAEWYDPATLQLLEGSPINCLLLTFSAGAAPEIESRQRQLVQKYARAAHERGLAALGILYPGADAGAAAAAAVEANLDGLVLDGVFPGGAAFEQKVEAALRAAGSQAVVIPIAADARSVRTQAAGLVAVEGAKPGAHNLSEMGATATASSEPWIDSNIWMVRSLRTGKGWRPVWVNQDPGNVSSGEYLRSIADSAVAGGRWIVTMGDELRLGLFRREPAALDSWRRAATYLRFAEEHAAWRSFNPYGNLAIILDNNSDTPDASEEYLNLVTRRQVPYRILPRSEASAASLAGLRAVLAADLAQPSGSERALLRGFAEKGGLVIGGPAWGQAPKDDPYAEAPLGRGRLVVYKDDPPDPESVARDLLELLSPEVMGLSLFNVPSAIAYASTASSGKAVLLQLLNYASVPSDRVTIRLNGTFQTARLFTPENQPLDLPARKAANGQSEVLIPRLEAWAALLLE